MHTHFSAENENKKINLVVGGDKELFMKKILSLILCAAMICTALLGAVGCGKRDPNDKGATILMYLAADPSNLNLDPAKLIYSHEAIKFIGLIFEGLTKFDENGKVVKGMADKWTFEEDPEHGVYKMLIELKETKWSDGILVMADDFVYAWKRILEPEFESPAASLLFGIQNARSVKAGDMTIDDLGVAALDMLLLEITFEPDKGKPDYDKFLEYLASPALVPVRADTIDPDPEGWAKKTLTLLTNGPFSIKQMEYNKATMLERSTYYMLEGKKDEDIFKFVEPYRIFLDYTRNLSQIEQAYASNNFIFYLGDVPADRFSAYKDVAELKDMLSTYSYHFNATRAPFDKAEVRKALSIALDRNKIAEIVSLGVKPATGIVPIGIIDVDNKTFFRDKAGDAIPAGGDTAAAKSLLQQAGVSGGSFSLKIGTGPAERAVAEYAAGVWQSLGFTVNIEEIRGLAYSETIFNREYDVMAYTDQALTADAFSVLAPFAKPFCGQKITFLSDAMSDIQPYITGFQNDAYDALIEEVFASNADREIYAQKLHEAEKMLVNLSPVAPLYFNTNINITEEISGLKYSKFGYTIFSGAKLRNYQQYETTLEETRETIVAQDD